MSRAEKFIQEYTRNCSNEYLTDSKPDGLGGYISRRKFSPWLTPDQARRAVEIAREEVIEWLKDNASKYIINTTPSYPDADFNAIIGGKCWEDLKKDE